MFYKYLLLPPRKYFFVKKIKCPHQIFAWRHCKRRPTSNSLLKLFNIFMIYLYHLANFKKWSNTLKQFVRKLATNCLSVFDHFAGLVLKGLSYLSGFSFNWDSQITGERGKEEANSTLSQEIFAAWNFRSNFILRSFLTIFQFRGILISQFSLNTTTFHDIVTLRFDQRTKSCAILVLQ